MTKDVYVQIKKLNRDIKLPVYATLNAAGMDVYALENSVLSVGETRLIKLGFAIELPVGYEMQVRSRSGLTLTSSISVLNSPGTIDSDYRGEVGVILHNHGTNWHSIFKGDRICQLVLKEVPHCIWHEVEDLSNTDRGTGGFGSTNKDIKLNV